MARDRITLLKRGDSELEEKKSRFLGHAVPVRNEKEALDFISEMKREYSDATHNVYAYYINGGASTRCSDDGEPQGSSGYPTLNALKTCGADDLCVVVTRYFGGTLLGTAGLARMYAAAARAAIEAAGFARFSVFSVCRLTVTYAEYQRLAVILKNEGIDEDEAEFTDKVTVTAAVSEEKLEKLGAVIRDLTGGRSELEITGEEERPVAL